MTPKDRLIVALDVGSVAEAQRIVGAVGTNVTTFKVGKQLFVAEGPRAVSVTCSAASSAVAPARRRIAVPMSKPR